MEESGRRESFAPTYGVHINPVSKGKQIPLCSSGQGCTHEGGPFQRPPIDCTDLNYRTLKTLFSIHHQHHSYTVGPNDKTRQPKIREINWSSLCLQQFDGILDMKCMQWPETEVMWIYWNLFWKIREITSAGEIIFGGCHFETLCSNSDNYYIEASIEKIYYGFCRKLIKNCSATALKKKYSNVWNRKKIH